MAIISKNLIKLRLSKNVTQKELADFLNVSQNTISDWESGKTDIKSSFLPKIAEYFKIEISELFENDSKIIIKQVNKDQTKENYSGYIIDVSNVEDRINLIDDKLNQIINFINK